MPENEKVIEHHYTTPSRGDVIKAMHQYLADQGVTTQTLMELIDKKMEAAIQQVVSKVIQSGSFEKLLIGAVAETIRTEKATFDRSGMHGFHARIRDLVQDGIKEAVLNNYTISVTPK